MLLQTPPQFHNIFTIPTAIPWHFHDNTFFAMSIIIFMNTSIMIMLIIVSSRLIE